MSKILRSFEPNWFLRRAFLGLDWPGPLVKDSRGLLSGQGCIFFFFF